VPVPCKDVGRVGIWLHSFVITFLSTGCNTPGAVGIEVGVGPRVGLDVFVPTSVFRPRMFYSRAKLLYDCAIAASI